MQQANLVQQFNFLPNYRLNRTTTCVADNQGVSYRSLT